MTMLNEIDVNQDLDIQVGCLKTGSLITEILLKLNLQSGKPTKFAVAERCF